MWREVKRGMWSGDGWVKGFVCLHPAPVCPPYLIFVTCTTCGAGVKNSRLVSSGLCMWICVILVSKDLDFVCFWCQLKMVLVWTKWQISNMFANAPTPVTWELGTAAISNQHFGQNFKNFSKLDPSSSTTLQANESKNSMKTFRLENG